MSAQASPPDYPVPARDAERIVALRAYRVLDTPPEPALDELARLASAICETPMAMVSLVDEHRQFFKSAIGVTRRETPREEAFCAHVVADARPLVVPDAAADARFVANPLVTGDPGIRFYAGQPLVSPEGHVIGALCVVDRRPRVLRGDQLEALSVLARAVMIQLELRRTAIELAERVEEQQRAQRALAESEARYRLLFDENPQPMWVYDLETYAFLAVNNAAVGQYGYSRDEFLRMTIVDLRPDGEQADFRQYLRREQGGLPSRSRSGVWHHRRKNGEELEVEITSHAVAFAGHAARLVLAQDVSEQRKAERAIVESRQRLAQAMESADLGFWEYDVVRGTLHVDERWIETHAVQVDANGELPFDRWLDGIHPDDRGQAADQRDRHFRGETAVYESDYRILTPAGTRWVHVRGRVVARDARGVPLKAAGTLLDITARKLLEAQFLRAQRMESIGTLAGGIAHDLNNVLTPILMAADLLKVYTEQDPAMHTTVQMIEESATRGAEMVKQVLSFARGYDGARVELQPAHLVRDVARIVRDTFPRAITVDTSWPRDLWTVSADPTQLHQVLLNLCVNARDAMAAGGQLTLRAGNVVLDETTAREIADARPGHYVLLSVGDTGSGISPVDRDRIFEPFYTTKEPGAGTGLGLSTALAIVRSHQGVIDVTSEPERGATFRVFLPALDAGAPPAGDYGDLLIPRGHGELLLVVDDEPSIRAICRRTLEAFGYRVVTASDGAEAIAIYAQHHGEVAAVLLDMMMPIMDGPATARALVRMNPQLRIVGGSGLAEDSMAPRATAAGVVRFLPKPYSTEALLHTMAELLS